MEKLFCSNTNKIASEDKDGNCLSNNLRAFPAHLDIEPTSRCNFNCTFCDKQPLVKKHQLGDMPLSLFKKIIDEGILNDIQSVQLCYRGEPLLNKEIVEMVRYAKEQGVEKVYFCTNGTLLTPLKIRNLISVGLDEITISVQGTDAATFEAERFGANFELILRNIQCLFNEREKQTASIPKIKIQAVKLPDLDLDEYRSFWKRYCDVVSIMEYKDAQERTKGVKSKWICPQPWQRMTVEWEGTILPCNNDDIRKYSPGNVNDMTLKEAWHSEAINTVRNSHIKGCAHLIEDCDGCPLRAIYI